MGFNKTRTNMVINAFEPNGIVDKALLDAFLKVEREYFVSAHLKDHALIYEDSLKLAENRFLSNSKVYAKLLQEAHITPEDKVLVLPLSCGYYAAIIASLAGEVWGIETAQNKDLFDLSLKTSTYPKDRMNFALKSDLENGYEEQAPYDLIFIDGAVETFPYYLFDQLNQNGRILYVDHSNPNYFHGRIMYKDGKGSDLAYTETSVPICNLFRRDDVFKF
jgi:protein-L-isoaspartate(D-aspartate) O-methyltransferase